MATLLKASIEFANIAAGDTVVLPHGLNIDGRGIAPDQCDSNNVNLVVQSADDTNVTVTNIGSGAESGYVLCDRWHTIVRNVPAGAVNLIPQPFVPASGGAAIAALASTPAQSLVWQPAGTRQGNVYADWTELYTARQQIDGPVVIGVDDSLDTPVVPAGTWNLINTEIRAASPFGQVYMEFAADCNILDCAMVTGPFSLWSYGVGTINTPVFERTMGAPLTFRNEIEVEADGVTTEFVDLGKASGDLNLFDRVVFGSGVVIDVSTGVHRIFMRGRSELQGDNFAGPNSADVLLYMQDESRILHPQAPAGYATVPDKIPSMGFARMQMWPSNGTPSTAAALAIPTGMMLLANGNGGFGTGTLPSAGNGAFDGYMEGILCGIKETSGLATVDVASAGADTIDGGAGPITVPAGGSRLYMCDGNGGWWTVGAYL